MEFSGRTRKFLCHLGTIWERYFPTAFSLSSLRIYSPPHSPSSFSQMSLMDKKLNKYIFLIFSINIFFCTLLGGLCIVFQVKEGKT